LFHKVKEIHYRTPHLVFPTANLKPLSVAITNIAACSGATYLLEDELMVLARFIKENDPDGKITRAATRKENARLRNAQGLFGKALAEKSITQSVAGDDISEHGEWCLDEFGDDWAGSEEEPIIVSD
jgi:hypothetical protein